MQFSPFSSRFPLILGAITLFSVPFSSPALADEFAPSSDFVPSSEFVARAGKGKKSDPPPRPRPKPGPRDGDDEN